MLGRPRVINHVVERDLWTGPVNLVIYLPGGGTPAKWRRFRFLAENNSRKADYIDYPIGRGRNEK